MRMGDLFHSDVVDVDGVAVGRVHDVQLLRDGPTQGGFGPALRVDGLVVGKGSLAIRLGYYRAGVQGPFLLGRVFRVLEGRARFVPWSQVDEHDADRITLRCPVGDLPRVRDLG